MYPCRFMYYVEPRQLPCIYIYEGKNYQIWNFSSTSAMAHQGQGPLPGSDNVFASTTPTQPPFLSRDRSSTWSTVDNPPHHNQGTSYYSQASTSPTAQFHPSPPILRNTPHTYSRQPTRSRSASSSQATHGQDEGVLSGDDEDSSNETENEGKERNRYNRRRGKAPASLNEDDSGEGDDGTEDPITTLKDRQSLINVQHPFGLPIWKPALYKKSRSVTRHADEALHSVPSAQAERHLLPGNLFWAIAFGWWLGVICIIISVLLRIVPQGGENYSNLVYGLGWYLFWPFGKYVEGPEPDDIVRKDDDEAPHPDLTGDHIGVQPSTGHDGGDDDDTIRRQPSGNSTVTPGTIEAQGAVSFAETTPLLSHVSGHSPVPVKSYGTAPNLTSLGMGINGYASDPKKASRWIGRVCFWLALVTIIAPLMLLVCTICWALVVTIPMAKLNWVLLKNLFGQPTKIRFCAVPLVVVFSQPSTAIPEETADTEREVQPTTYSIERPRLSAGQEAPSGSRVLLCTYRAAGLKYYKYTVGGVNIMFVNLLPVVFFVIFDGFVLMPLKEGMEHHGKHVPAFLALLTSHGFIFFLSLMSVIPLSYFIGMAVASISAQSSIGMGAVINATFGSIIEIILYGIALTQSKGHLVEGSIIGSLLAGVLLMPGMSMCSGALRRKEQSFNAKSASVTSMMLIMALIGAIAPTLFYQIYGNVSVTFV